MKKIFLFIICLMLSSCSVVIPKHGLVELSNIDKNRALFEIDQYNTRVLQKADIQSNIIFNFRGRTMNALGLTSIDENSNAYKVAALNPMGVTLFQLNVKDNKIISSYIIPQFTPGEKKQSTEKADKAANMISKDISHVYFNRIINTEKDLIKLNKYNVVINTKTQDNEYFKYIFTGKPLRLSTKIKFKNAKKTWSVDYYKYETTGQKEMPFKVILQNHKYGYTLEIETNKVSKE
jgi:outer membrane biogenesis lipoprotein LolB